MAVIYYYYYLFYGRILKDSEPHLLTTMAISASEAFAVIAVLELIMIGIFCYSMGKWIMLAILLIFNVLNYLIYQKSNKAKEIVKNRPKYFGKHRLSVLLVLLFFFTTLSVIFWMPILSSKLLANCSEM